MLAHGKVASPFVYRTRGAAPASKAQQVAGAGERANSRKAAKVRAEQSREHMQRLATQRTTNDAIAHMTSVAKKFARMAENKADPNRIAFLWIAQAIGADAARRFSEGCLSAQGIVADAEIEHQFE